MKDFDKFTYKKVQVIQDKATYFFWYLINKDRREGVHFHGALYEDKTMCSLCNQHGFMTHGIEAHRKTPSYKEHKPVPNCDVTGGDCYCDGSSLQAEQHLGHIDPTGRDDDIIWNVLHEYYGHWIEPTAGSA